MGMGLVDFLHYFVDGLGVDQAHQIPTEAVDMVLIGPVFHGVHDILLDHGPLGGGIVSAGGAGGEDALSADTAEEQGNDLVEAEFLAGVHMVVDHIHDHLNAVVMEAFHHGLKFLHADFTVEGVGGVGTFGHIVVHGIVAPVEDIVFQGCLVHGAVVVGGQQVDVGDAQGLDMVQAGGDALRSGGAGLDEAQKFALIGDAGILVHAQVPDVKLIDDGIGDAGRLGGQILSPTLGIGGIQIDDHGPLAVDAHSPGIGIAGLVGDAVHIHHVGVVGAAQVTLHGGNPGAVNVRGHFHLPDQIIHPVIAGGVEIDLHSSGSGSPEPEEGLLLAPVGAQIVALVGVQGLKNAGRVVNGHGDGHFTAAVVQGVRCGHIQRLRRHQGVGVLAVVASGINGNFALRAGDGQFAGVNGGGHGHPDADTLPIEGLLDGGISFRCQSQHGNQTQHQGAQQQNGDDSFEQIAVHGIILSCPNII